MQSRGTLNAEHDRHDRVLIARYATGDAYPSEVDEARELVDRCDSCAALAGDIRLISARTADLPAARRPRDFRITPQQADKLRGSWFDRLMRGFSAPGWSVVRPVAAASLAIGIVLIVVGALPIALTGSASSETVPGSQDHAAYDNRSEVPLSASAPTVAQMPAASAAPASAAASAAAQPLPAASTVPDAAGAASGTPQTVDNAASMAASTSVPMPPEINQEGPSSAPPKRASEAPTTGDTSGQVAAGPSAPPANLGSVTAGQAQVGTVSQSIFDRSSLVLIGIVVAFLALIALGLLWMARRRYSDPLVR
ncbi:MAG TPA: hypothetical protein VH371_08440 [Candidatus Limnocylindrales bacterium]|jgi:hypothetical protein